MAQWSVSFTKEADKDLVRLSQQVRGRVLEKIQWLLKNFDNINHLPFGYGWQGFFKLRVGNWRIIYEIDYLQSKITVHHIGPRDKIYKKRKR